MSQGAYVSIDDENIEHPFYPIYGTHLGNYTFNNVTYSIWRYIENYGRDGGAKFLFSHQDNEKYNQCLIKFRIELNPFFDFIPNIFVYIYLCDIGPGIGREMLKAFMNYLLNRSKRKIITHHFTGDTHICLTPDRVAESTRVGDTITYNEKKLIRYYRRLGFNIDRDNDFSICGTITNILNSIENENNLRSLSRTRSGKSFRTLKSRTVSKMPTPQIPLQIKEEPTPNPTPTPSQSIFSGIFSRFGFGGGKHKITRKRRK